jgi:hypothetical protein
MTVPAVQTSARFEQGCIFCRRHDGGFVGEEHVFPRGLGNDEVILPPGAVCDRCNNGPLADVDQAFLQLPHVQFVRVMLGVESREGKRPESRWVDGTVSSPQPGHLLFDLRNERAFKELEPGRMQLSVSSGGPISVARYRKLLRAIYKMVIECICIDSGAHVFEPKFDSVRDMVIGTRPVEGFIVNPRQGEPNPQVSLTYQARTAEGREFILVELNVAGVVFLTELLERRLALRSEELEQAANVIEL